MNVCVFCGSSFGHSSVYQLAAAEVGKLIATAGMSLVYGGGNVGLMGVVADSVLQHSGKVTGVIPFFLHEREVAHTGLTELFIVKSMHERKMKMAELSSAFIALPGGLGTLDELAEILTWRQLGLINAPIGLLNTNNYFSHLIMQMDKMVSDGFLAQQTLQKLVISETPRQLFSLLHP